MTCRAFGWKILPYPGGFLNWPEWLVHDLVELESEYARVKEELGDK